MTSKLVSRYVELGECINLIIDHRGKTPKKLNSDWVNDGVPTISAKNVNSGKLVAKDAIRYVTNEVYKKWMKEDVQPGDCLLVSEGATLGECLYWDDNYPVVLGQRLFCIRTNPEILYPRYFYAYMNSVEFQSEILGRATGSSVLGLRQTEVLQLKVKLLPMKQQIFIGDLLYNINKKTEKNSETNQTLEAIAQTLFKSWFVDFDPVKAKISVLAAGGSAEEAERAAMCAISARDEASLNTLQSEQPKAYAELARTAALFPSAMQDSELGEIPEGWTCGALGDICSFTAGSAFKSEYQGNTEGDFPFIKVSDMNLAGNEVFIQAANNYISKAQQAELRAKLHPLGATVFAKIGVALISNRRRLLTTPTLVDNNMMSASPIEGRTWQYCLYSLLCTLDFNTVVSGTALPYLNVSDLKKIPIVRPHNEVYWAYELKASSIFSMIQTQSVQSSNLAAIRDSLLPKLLSGELYRD